MFIPNVLHVFSDNLSFKNKQVINGIELLAIPQGTTLTYQDNQLDGYSFITAAQPVMVMCIHNCYHVYVTLSTFTKYSTIQLEDFIELTVPHNSKAQLDKMKTLTTARVLHLMNANPCITESHMVFCNNSQGWLIDEILIAQNIYCKTPIGIDTLEVLAWVIIPKDTTASETGKLKDQSCTPTTSNDQSMTLNQTVTDTTLATYLDNYLDSFSDVKM